MLILSSLLSGMTMAVVLGCSAVGLVVAASTTRENELNSSVGEQAQCGYHARKNNA